MEFEPIDLKVLRNQFKRATEDSANEEELKIALEGSMKAFFKKYDIEYDPKYEMTVIKGRVVW